MPMGHQEEFPIHPLAPVLDISNLTQMRCRGVPQYKNPEDPCSNAGMGPRGHRYS